MFRAGWFITAPEADDDTGERTLVRNRATYGTWGKHTAIPLRWQDGLFVPDTDAATWRRCCEDVFLRLLDQRYGDDVELSASPQAVECYAPAMFANLSKVERGGYRETEFKAAMRVLIAKQFIKSLDADPNSGVKTRSPRLYRIKRGWFSEGENQ